MIVEFEDSNRNPLCFKHAVERVLKNNEYIKVSASDTVDADGSGCFPLPCIECFPIEEDDQ